MIKVTRSKERLYGIKIDDNKRKVDFLKIIPFRPPNLKKLKNIDKKNTDTDF